MFHPNDRPMERGWVGRIDGDRVVHLAAQTLQSFFLGGGGAREHAEYRLGAVTLLVPVLHPPSVRLFESEDTFVFANPAAVHGPDATVVAPDGGPLTLGPRLAAVIGAGGAIGGFSVFADWRAPARRPPKDADFGLQLGPVVVTPDELEDTAPEAVVRVDGDERLRGALPRLDWESARAFAAEGTELRPGDVLASPAAGLVSAVAPGSSVEVEVAGIGVLRGRVASS